MRENAAVMSSSPVDLVALDIDGTVLTPEHGVAPSTVAAVEEARARGVHVVLASSRGPVALAPIQDALDLTDEWFIGYQGALVARRHDGDLDVLAQHPVDPAIAREVEDSAVALGLSVGRYIGQRWRVPRLTEAIRAEAAITGEIPLLSAPDDADHDDPPHKVLVIAEPDLIPELARLASDLPPGVSATFSHANYLEVTAAGVDKATGLRPLIAHLGIPPARTAAVGDGLNDLALFAAVAQPIAMGHAPAQVRAAARWVTSSNDDGGVARALAWLGVAAGR
jgi:Cof subfamily protein (haloacid dehalogenase superfamily)